VGHVNLQTETNMYPPTLPKQFLHFTSCGYTHIRPVGAGVIEGTQYQFRGTSVEALTGHMIELGNQVERCKRQLRALHAVVQSMDAEAVTYVSIDSASVDVRAL
jgi:hypothetical protein